MTLYHSPYTKAFLDELDLTRTDSGKLGKRGHSSTGWFNEYKPRNPAYRHIEIHAISFNERNVTARKKQFQVNIWLGQGIRGTADFFDSVPEQTLAYLASIDYPPAVAVLRKRIIDEVLAELP